MHLEMVQYLIDDVLLLLLLLEQLFVLFQELLVLLLDNQLLQGLCLSAWLLRQRGRLGSSQGAVAPHKLGHSGRGKRQATQTDCEKYRERFLLLSCIEFHSYI